MPIADLIQEVMQQNQVSSVQLALHRHFPGCLRPGFGVRVVASPSSNISSPAQIHRWSAFEKWCLTRWQKGETHSIQIPRWSWRLSPQSDSAAAFPLKQGACFGRLPKPHSSVQEILFLTIITQSDLMWEFPSLFYGCFFLSSECSPRNW